MLVAAIGDAGVLYRKAWGFTVRFDLRRQRRVIRRFYYLAGYRQAGELY
jgi:hypothetical protein